MNYKITKALAFHELKPGDYFKVSGIKYLKVAPGYRYNAVAMTNFRLTYIQDYVSVDGVGKIEPTPYEEQYEPDPYKLDLKWHL